MSDDSSRPGIDVFADRFKSAWLTGNAISIEECLAECDVDERELATEILVQLEMRLRFQRPLETPDIDGTIDEGHAEADSPQIARPAIPKTSTIEAYLERFPVLDKPDSLSVLVEQEVRLRREHGEDISLDEYRARLKNLPFDDESTETHVEAATSDPDATIEESPADPLTTLAEDEAGPVHINPRLQVGRYRLAHMQGQGGFGTVWRAIDPKLGREVAIKQLKSQIAASENARRRFVSEARISARLQHPGVVPVHDLGLDQDDPFYAMKFVQGETLADVIKAFHAGQSPDRQVEQMRLLNVFLSVARTMEYAHSVRIVHRDLKPQNVIVGDFGETIILDWGLAKALDGDESPIDPETAAATGDDGEVLRTQAGAQIGTPSFMSPEQAAGDVDHVDELSDIYSLGAVLYQILTGRLPFEGRSSREVMDRVRGSEPAPRPRQFSRLIASPLESICLKALQKQREARYQSTAELIGDMERYLADEPVSAHQETFIERVSRWGRRNRAWVRAGGTALLVVSAVSVVAAFVINEFRNTAEFERGEAVTAKDNEARERAKAVELAETNAQLAADEARERQKAQLLAEENAQLAADEARERQRAEQRLYDNLVASAGREFETGNVDRARRLLDQCLPPYRKWEWWLLRSMCEGEQLKLASDPDRSFVGVAFGPSGDLIASIDRSGELHLFDTESGLFVKGWSVQAEDGRGLSFSSNGQQIAVVDENRLGHEAPFRRVIVVPVSEGAGDPLLNDARASAHFLPDRPSIAAVTGDGRREIGLWNATTGELQRVLPERHGASITNIDVSRDGQWMASVSTNREVGVWNVGLGTRETVISIPASGRFLPGGESARQLEDVAEDQPGGDGPSPECVAINSDGSLVAVSLLSRSDWIPADPVMIWDRNGELLQTVFVPGGAESICFATTQTDDGNSQLDPQAESPALDATPRLITGGTDGVIRVWDVASGEPVQRLRGHTGRVSDLAVHPDGHQLASAGFDGSVRLWSLKPTRPRRIGSAVMTLPTLQYAPDGRTVMTGIQPVSVTPPRRHVLTHTPALSGPTGVFTRDGSQFASIADNGDIKVWNTLTGRLVETLPHPVGMTDDSMPLGRLVSGESSGLALVSDDGRIWRRVPSSAPLTELPHKSDPVDFVFGLNDQRLLIETLGGDAALWDRETGRQIADVSLVDRSTPFRCSPESHWFYAGTNSGRVVRIDAQGGETQDLVPAVAGYVRAVDVGRVQVSIEGSRQLVLVLAEDRQVHAVSVYDLLSPSEESLQAQVQLPETTDPVAAALDVAGNRVAVLNRDGTVLVVSDLGTGESFTLPVREGNNVDSEGFTLRWLAGGSYIIARPSLRNDLFAEPSVWSMPSGHSIAGSDFGRAVVFSQEGSWCAVNTGDGQTELRRVTSGENSGAAPAAGPGRIPEQLTLFSPRGNRQLILERGRVELWNAALTERLADIPLAENLDALFEVICFSNDGRWLAVPSAPGRLAIYDAFSGEHARTLETEPHLHGLTSIRFSRRNDWILAGGRDGNIAVWSRETGALKRHLPSRERGKIVQIRVSPRDETLIAVAGEDDGFLFADSVDVIEFETGQQLTRLDSREDKVSGVEVSPDGSRILTWNRPAPLTGGGRFQLEVQLWNATTGELVSRLDGHRSVLTAVAFNNKSDRIVTADVSGGMRVWHADSGRQILALPGRQPLVMKLDFSPDDTCLAGLSSDPDSRSERVDVLLWETPAFQTAPDRIEIELRQQRTEDIKALVRRGPSAVPELLRLLGSDNESTRIEAAFALHEVAPGQAPSAINVFAEAMTHPDLAPQARAILKELGADAVDAVAGLLDSDNERVRMDAALLLIDLDATRGREASPVLVSFLANLTTLQQFDPRPHAAVAGLAKLGTHAERDLIRLLGHSLPRVRFAVADALREMKPALATKTIPVLCELCGHEDWRPSAMNRLRQDGKSALSALVESVSNPNLLVRSAAAELLVELEPDRGVDHLDIFRDGLTDTRLREASLKLLTGLGRRGSPAIPDLVALLRQPTSGEFDFALADDDSLRQGLTVVVKQDVVATLVAIGPAALDPLTAAVTDRHAGSFALEGLGKFPTAFERVIPILLEQLRATRLSDRRHQAAAKALAELAPHSIDPLFEALAERTVSRTAASTLGNLQDGPHRERVHTGLLERLNDESPSVRTGAAIALWNGANRFNPDELAVLRPTIPVWIETARSASATDRALALSALEAFVFRLDEKPEDASDVLLQVFSNGEGTREAARLLAAVAPDRAAPAIPFLIEELDSLDLLPRIEAAELLADIGPEAKSAAPRLREIIDDSSLFDPMGKLRAAVRRALESVSRPLPPEQRLPQLIQILRAAPEATTPEKQQRQLEALREIHTLGEQAKDAVPVLISALQDGPAEIRQSVIYALDRTRDRSDSVLDAIKSPLDDEAELVRLQACFAFWNLTRMSRLSDWLPVLEALFRDGSPQTQGSAVRVLVEIVWMDSFGPFRPKNWDEKNPAVPILVAALTGEAIGPRVECLTALADMHESGNFGTRLTAAITPLLDDESPRVTLAAVLALRSRDADAATVLPAVTRILNHDDAEAVQQAAVVLSSLAAGDDDALDAMNSALSHTQAEVREKVVALFARLGERASTSVPDIADRLKDNAMGVRLAASATLADLGPVAKSALPALMAALEGSTGQESLNINLALWAIDPSLADDVATRVGKRLESAPPGSRKPVLDVLYSMRGDAKAAIPAITAFARDVEQPPEERIDSLVVYATVAGQESRQLIREIASTDSNRQVATAAQTILERLDANP